MVVREVLVFGDLFFETVEVELVFDEVLVDLTEEQVILQPAEPLDPTNIDILTELRFLTHFKSIFLN